MLFRAVWIKQSRCGSVANCGNNKKKVFKKSIELNCFDWFVATTPAERERERKK